MAASVPTVCLACGCDAVAGERRSLASEVSSVVLPTLKYFISKRTSQQSSNSPLVLDEFIHKCFVCRKCFNVYKTYQEKGDRLYEATEKPIALVSLSLNQSEESDHVVDDSQL